MTATLPKTFSDEHRQMLDSHRTPLTSRSNSIVMSPNGNILPYSYEVQGHQDSVNIELLGIKQPHNVPRETI